MSPTELVYEEFVIRLETGRWSSWSGSTVPSCREDPRALGRVAFQVPPEGESALVDFFGEAERRRVPPS